MPHAITSTRENNQDFTSLGGSHVAGAFWWAAILLGVLRLLSFQVELLKINFG